MGVAASDDIDELARGIYLVARSFLENIRGEHPALVDAFDAKVVCGIAAFPGAPLGVFRPNRWRRGSERFHQLDVNLTPRGSKPLPSMLVALEVFDTIVHELAHLYADVLGIDDMSADGVAHNVEFARLASMLGLHVRRVPRIGHATSGPTPATQRRFAGHIKLLAFLLDTHRLSLRHVAAARPHAVVFTPGSRGTTLDVFDLVPVRGGCPTTSRSIAPLRAPVSWWAHRDVICNYCGQLFRELT